MPVGLVVKKEKSYILLAPLAILIPFALKIVDSVVLHWRGLLLSMSHDFGSLLLILALFAVSCFLIVMVILRAWRDWHLSPIPVLDLGDEGLLLRDKTKPLQHSILYKDIRSVSLRPKGRGQVLVLDLYGGREEVELAGVDAEPAWICECINEGVSEQHSGEDQNEAEALPPPIGW